LTDSLAVAHERTARKRTRAQMLPVKVSFIEDGTRRAYSWGFGGIKPVWGAKQRCTTAICVPAYLNHSISKSRMAATRQNTDARSTLDILCLLFILIAAPFATLLPTPLFNAGEASSDRACVQNNNHLSSAHGDSYHGNERAQSCNARPLTISCC
jgi:hypothetical protein